MEPDETKVTTIAEGDDGLEAAYQAAREKVQKLDSEWQALHAKARADRTLPPGKEHPAAMALWNARFELQFLGRVRGQRARRARLGDAVVDAEVDARTLQLAREEVGRHPTGSPESKAAYAHLREVEEFMRKK